MNHDPLYPTHANARETRSTGAPSDGSAPRAETDGPPPGFRCVGKCDRCDVEEMERSATPPNAPLPGVATALRHDGAGVWRGDTGMVGHDAAGEVDWKAEAERWKTQRNIEIERAESFVRQADELRIDRDAARAEVERLKAGLGIAREALLHCKTRPHEHNPPQGFTTTRCEVIDRGIMACALEITVQPATPAHPPCALPGCGEPGCDAERQAAERVEKAKRAQTCDVTAPSPFHRVRCTVRGTHTQHSDGALTWTEVEP